MRLDSFYNVTFIVLMTACPQLLLSQDVNFYLEQNKLKFIQGTSGNAKCTVDINSDGLDDLTRVSSEGIHIDFQNNDGTFLHKFFKKQIEVPPVYSICAGDLNNDGYNDLLFGGREKVSFLIYDLNIDQYIEQVMPQSITCQRATLFDIDNDGDLDAFVCNDAGKSQAFKNDGNGNMSLDQSLINTSPLAGNYSAIWVDVNNDNYTDLYISKCLAETFPGDPRRTNLLYKNNGDGTFSEIGVQAGVADNAQSWSTVFEDFDHDGDFDAFVVNHDDKNRLYRNNGDGTFTDVIHNSGIDAGDLGAFENSAGDFDNDGHMDILSELKNQLYLGNGDLTFIGQKLPLLPYAIGDFNDDGHLDFTSRNTLCFNEGNSNHYIKFILKGVESNKNGLGAKVVVKSNGLTQTRELRSGESYSPMHSLNLHFGLGQSTMVDEVAIHWPSGISTKLYNLPADSNYIIVETACLLSEINISSNDDMLLCPNESITLHSTEKYEKYLWNTGDTTESILIDIAGWYSLVYEDSLSCRGYSQVLIKAGDADFTRLSIDSTDLILCEGESTTLHANSSQEVNWSNGIKDKSIEISEAGIYFFIQDSVCGTGKYISDSVEVNVLSILPPELISMQQINDSVRVEISGQHCLWFKSESNTNPIYEGCILKIPIPFEEKILYVENRDSQGYLPISCGKINDSGFKNISKISRRMYFSIHEDIVLESIDIYKRNKTEDATKISVSTTQGEPVVYKEFMPNIGPNTLLTNFDLPAGNYYMSTNDTTLFMNIGPMDYPYPIGNFGSIDSANISYNFYPYFYNWKVRKSDKYCFSKRTPILIKPSSISEKNEKIKVFPNPASDILNIELSGSKAWSLEVYNDAGQSVFEKNNIIKQNEILPLGVLTSGLYLLKISRDGVIDYKRFVVVKM